MILDSAVTWLANGFLLDEARNITPNLNNADASGGEELDADETIGRVLPSTSASSHLRYFEGQSVLP